MDNQGNIKWYIKCNYCLTVFETIMLIFIILSFPAQLVILIEFRVKSNIKFIELSFAYICFLSILMLIRIIYSEYTETKIKLSLISVTESVNKASELILENGDHEKAKKLLNFSSRIKAFDYSMIVMILPCLVICLLPFREQHLYGRIVVVIVIANLILLTLLSICYTYYLEFQCKNRIIIKGATNVRP